MAFKKTNDGRVFFQNLDDEDKAPVAAPASELRRRQTQRPANTEPVNRSAAKARPPLTRSPQTPPAKAAPKAPEQGQTQFQILTLLKSLNVRLQKTQAERDDMRKQLNRYERMLAALEGRAVKSQQSYETLSQKMQTGQVELSSKAEKIASSAASSVKGAQDTIAELEARIENADIALKEQEEARLKIESDLAARQVELDDLQKEQHRKIADYALSTKNLTKRLNKAEEAGENFNERLNEAASRFDAMDHRLEKTLEERSRMLAKIERIEDAVMQTRDAISAQAPHLLENPNAAPLNDEDAGEAAARKILAFQAQNNFNEKKPWAWKAVGVSVLVIAALSGMWVASQPQAPLVLDKISLSKPAPATTQNKVVEDAQNNVQGKTQDAELDVAQVNNTIAPAAGQSDVAVLNPYREQSPVAQISPVQDIVPDAAPVRNSQVSEVENDIGAIQITDEGALIKALDTNPQAVAEKMNAIEPSVAVATGAIVDAIDPADIQYPESAFGRQAAKYAKKDNDLPESVRVIEDKAMQGVADAQHDLAAIYTAGHAGIDPDYKRAAYWFDQSARQGVPNAAYNLGVLYHQGLGVTQNLETALGWYEAATIMNHPEAAYNLGIAHIEGIGVDYNAERAAQNFETAANAGVTEAAYNLGLIYENGLLGQSQPDEALMWYKIASDANNPEAGAALEQLAKTLDIPLKEVNRLADSMIAGREKVLGLGAKKN
jgi:TPR repeat protein/CII-binding regulator of phage lambda lysogenization HflD